jgi:hypothetical protein
MEECSKCGKDLADSPLSMVHLGSNAEIEPHKTHVDLQVCFPCLMDIRKYAMGHVQRSAVDALFNMTPEQLGQAAVDAAKEGPGSKHNLTPTNAELEAAQEEYEFNRLMQCTGLDEIANFPPGQTPTYIGTPPKKNKLD